MPQNSSARTEPMSASGAPDFAQDAPATLGVIIKNNGRAPQEEPVCAVMPPAPVLARSGDVDFSKD